MKTASLLRTKRWLAILAAALTTSAVGYFQAANARQGPGDDDQSGTEVLNRGPIHEAFANPITYDPTTGPVVPNEPSDPIEEQPPDQKPEGDNVQWISGYWAWDDERTDFIWISGIWREPPPDCQWTPGYWDQCDGGYADLRLLDARRMPRAGIICPRHLRTSSRDRAVHPASSENGNCSCTRATGRGMRRRIPATQSTCGVQGAG